MMPKFLSATLVLSIFLLAAPNSRAGWESGNGGDEDALEFVSLGQQIAKESSLFYRGILNDADIARIRAAVNSTKVESTASTLQIDGVEKDAVNFPEQKLIRINRARWERMQKNTIKLQLVFHEYLSISGIDDSHYLISSKLYGPWANPVGQLSDLAGGLLVRIAALGDTMSSNFKSPAQPCFESGKLMSQFEQAFDFWITLESEIPVDSHAYLDNSRPYHALEDFSGPLNDYCLGPDSAQARAKLLVNLKVRRTALEQLLFALRDLDPHKSETVPAAH